MKRTKRTTRVIRMTTEYFVIILMAFLSALEFVIFIEKNQFAPSGMMGIATMIQHVFGISVGYLSLLVNIPLCAIGYFFIGKRYAIRTGVYIFAFSEALLLLQSRVIDVTPLVYYTPDGLSQILAPIASGAIGGLNYGAVILSSGSTGGIDIIAALLQKKRAEYNLMWIIFTFNVFVAILSYFVYGYNMQPVILCIIYSYLTSSVSDKILQGGKTALKFEVISKHSEEIGNELISTLKRGVTIVPAKGMYSKEHRDMLICVIDKRQITQFNRILHKYKDTFAYLSQVNEVVGDFSRKPQKR